MLPHTDLRAGCVGTDKAHAGAQGGLDPWAGRVSKGPSSGASGPGQGLMITHPQGTSEQAGPAYRFWWFWWFW